MLTDLQEVYGTMVDLLVGNIVYVVLRRTTYMVTVATESPVKGHVASHLLQLRQLHRGM